MQIGDLARPKGSPFKFQPIKDKQFGFYALEWTLGSGWKHVAFYKPEELEVQA